MEIHVALQEYFRSISLSQVAIAEKLGVTKAYVNALLSGRQRFGKKQAEIWSEKFGLSKAWLLTGEGEMLTQENAHDIEISVDDKPKAASRLIPLYDAETTGGFGGLVSSSNADVSLMGYVQAGSWFDGRETAAIRHTGNSMVEYPDGCVLAVREVTDRHLLVPGRNYVIETSEYRITKRVQKGSSPNTIALYSTNQEKYENGRLVHEPFEVDIADIRRIFSVLGYIVNQSGEYRLIKP